MDIRSLQSIPTTEQIPLQMELSGMCSRLIAFIVDFFMMALLIVGLVGAVELFFNYGSEASKTIIPLIMFVVFFGYNLIQEWLMDGQSIGKRLFHIRVVREDGQPIGFWESLGRNLLRIIDVYFFALGILVMAISTREKRLGDYLVGSVVIQDKLTELQIIESTSQPTLKSTQPLPNNNPDKQALIEALADILTPEEKTLFQTIETRRKTLPLDIQQQWFNQLYNHLAQKNKHLHNLNSNATDEEKCLLVGRLITTINQQT